MKSVEFITDISKEAKIVIPKEIFSRLSNLSKVRILLLPQEDSEEPEAWREMGKRSFLAAGNSKDSIYDNL